MLQFTPESPADHHLTPVDGLPALATSLVEDSLDWHGIQVRHLLRGDNIIRSLPDTEGNHALHAQAFLAQQGLGRVMAVHLEAGGPDALLPCQYSNLDRLLLQACIEFFNKLLGCLLSQCKTCPAGCGN